MIAQYCDGAILVVRSGSTPRSMIRQSMNQLTQTGCRLLGTVLNGVATGNRAYGRYYYGYYYKYYSAYYGYGKSEKD
jgi:Mrp family chromosome partitioning ATPase